MKLGSRVDKLPRNSSFIEKIKYDLKEGNLPYGLYPYGLYVTNIANFLVYMSSSVTHEILLCIVSRWDVSIFKSNYTNLLEVILEDLGARWVCKHIVINSSSLATQNSTAGKVTHLTCFLCDIEITVRVPHENNKNKIHRQK